MELGDPGANFSRQQRGQGEPRPFHPRRFGETSDEDSAVCFFFFTRHEGRAAPSRLCVGTHACARASRESAIGVRRSDDRRPRSRTQHRPAFSEDPRAPAGGLVPPPPPPPLRFPLRFSVLIDRRSLRLSVRLSRPFRTHTPPRARQRVRRPPAAPR